ncbi:serine/threonine protein kinase [Dickeya dadantii]|uniref:serine/threonine-protein kinase n=1 Tax=Dickeya dadantii TaxID=204038 RepID=UPI00149555BB|nr:serine/threonine-protein kinase [Dickeya dadantii]NPE58364.1 serine/threonine protein kinase [Dickeya dadantii]NPE70851.1 serine/threonine protein kinase [Dickeya dadantii]
MEEHGNYRIRFVEKMRRGGFGYVEKVEIFNHSGVKCGNYARKIFSPRDGVDKEEFKRRFRREVIYQAKCVHTNIVPIYLHNLYGDNPWFIMDLAESDLSSEVASGTLSLENKVKIIDQILSGVNYLHQDVTQGRKDGVYLHRDLKPSNILKFNHGIYKISDFGLVKNIDSEQESEVLTQVATAMGTKKYMAPEVTSAGLYSFQSDIFALGVIIDEMDMKDINGIKQLIEKCTSWKPSSRYKSVAEMIDILEGLKIRNGL